MEKWKQGGNQQNPSGSTTLVNCWAPAQRAERESSGTSYGAARFADTAIDSILVGVVDRWVK